MSDILLADEQDREMFLLQRMKWEEDLAREITR